MHNICYMLTSDAYLLHVSWPVHHHQEEQLRQLLEKPTTVMTLLYVFQFCSLYVMKITIKGTTVRILKRLVVYRVQEHIMLDASRNVMAHAQKPDFVSRRNGRVHLNRRGASVQSTTGSRGVRISGSNAGYTMFRGSVKSTGYPLHSPVSPSLPLPCVTMCRHISAGFYHCLNNLKIRCSCDRALLI